MIRLKSSMMLGSMLLAGGIALGQTTSTATAASPSGTAATQVGDKWIEIVYSRPILRGRTDVFGKGADYGKKVLSGATMWRAGANVTTRLNTPVLSVKREGGVKSREYIQDILLTDILLTRKDCIYSIENPSLVS